MSAGGLGGTALWIYTEGDPPLRRLAALAPLTPGLEGTAHDPASRVLVDARVASAADLMAALDRADTLCRAAAASADSNTPPIRLVILDSVAALFRDVGAGPPGVAGAAEYGARAGLMFAAAAALKRLASEHGLVVVVVNQVVDVVADDGVCGGGDSGLSGQPPPLSFSAKAVAATGGQPLRTSGRAVAPALGLAWAHCVDTRLFLSRMVAGGAGGWGEGGCGGGGSAAAANQAPAPHTLRCLQVVFAPHLPPSFAYAVVTGAGLVGVRQDAVASAVAVAARAPLGEAWGADTASGAATQQAAW